METKVVRRSWRVKWRRARDVLVLTALVGTWAFRSRASWQRWLRRRPRHT